MPQLRASKPKIDAPVLNGLRAVLIDLDGTLIDRDAAVRAWLRGRGLNAKWARGQSLRSLAAELLARHPDMAASAEQLEARVRADLPGLIRPAPTVLDALDRLAGAGLRLGLVSNGGGPTQRAKLAAAGIAVDRFACVLISAEIGIAKPDARIFALALTRLGARPRRAVMVGDSLEHDIAGAAAQGLSSCWITHECSIEDEHRPPGPAPSMSAPSFAAAVDLLLSSAGALVPSEDLG